MSRPGAHRLRLYLWSQGAAMVGRAAAVLVAVTLAPAVGIAYLAGARFRQHPVVGQHGVLIREMEMSSHAGTRWPVATLALRVVQIVAGCRSWVGPDARVPGQLDLRREDCRRVLSLLPGLVSVWWLRCCANIAFSDQMQSDLDYLDNRSLRGDLGILARALPALGYGSARLCRETAEILGVPIDNLEMQQAIDAMVAPALPGRVRQVSFVNVDCVNKASGDTAYRGALLSSDLRLGDGIGLRIAGRIVGDNIRQNVNGTDLFPLLCERMRDVRQSLFLLGGCPGVAEGVAAWIEKNVPGLKVAGLHHGYFTAAEEPALLERINQSGAAVLLVAFGAPRQELWIRRHVMNLRVSTAVGVGGLFDFYSGRIPRAPIWLRELGLEWTYRLYQEPGRMWRRYLVGNVVFLARVLWSKRRGRRALATVEVNG